MIAIKPGTCAMCVHGRKDLGEMNCALEPCAAPNPTRTGILVWINMGNDPRKDEGCPSFKRFY